MLRNLIVLVLAIGVGASLTYWMDYSGGAVPKMQTLQFQEKSPQMVKLARVPEFEFQALDGKEIHIHDFKGKIVVLNFWASWCAPCVKEFPYFLKLAAEFPDDVVFIGLSSDFDMSAMNRFLSKLSYQHPRAMDGQNIHLGLDENGVITRDLFQTLRLPETFIIDKKGIMREKLIGANWAYDDLKAMVEGLR